MSFPTYALLALGTCFGVAVLLTTWVIYDDATDDDDWIVAVAGISVLAGALWPLALTALAVLGCAYPLAQYLKRKRAKS